MSGPSSAALLLPQIADALPDVVFRLRLAPVPVLEYINPAVMTQTGYTPDEFVADPGLIFGLVHPEDQAQLQAFIEAAALQFTCRVRWIARQGTVVHMDLGGAIERDAGGRARSITCIARNVTAQVSRELATRQAEASARTLLDHLPEVVARFDRSLRCILLNQTVANSPWATVGAFLGKTMDDTTMPAGVVEVWNSALQTVFATGQTVTIQTTSAPEGEPLHVEVTCVPEFAADGTVHSVVTVSRDISERKQVEKALTESKERLQMALQATHGGAWEFDIKTSTMDTSQYWLTLYGKEAGEPGPGFEEWQTTVHPEDLPIVMQAVQDHLDGLTPAYECEHRVLMPSGKYGTVLSRGRVIERDREGAPLRMVGIDIDVTELSQMLLAAQRLASIVASSADAITSTDLHGNFTSWNPGAERLYGYTTQEMLGRPVTALIPAELGPEWVRSLELLRNGESLKQQETRRIASDGRVVDVAVTLSPIRGQAGEIVGVAEVTRDIGERKAMEEALRQLNEELERRVEARTAELAAALTDLRRSDQLKDEFMAAVTHELRTPLTGVLGMTEILLAQAGDPLTVRQARYLHAIHQSGERLLALVNSILSYSSLISGRVEIVPESCHLAELCAIAVRAVAAHAEARHQTFEFTVEPPELTIVSDPEGIIQVLKRLLDNAVKFTPESGSIGLDVAEVDGCARLTVWDTGIGIAPAKIDSVFHAFTQEQGGLARPFGGVGLGLAYVRKMVELLKGTIVVDSTPGQGSRFSVMLPETL
jgi:PAS domain S-box-containing protein